LTRTGVPALRTKDADAARSELSDFGAGRGGRVLGPNEDVHSRDGGEDHRRDAHTEKEAHGQQFQGHDQHDLSLPVPWSPETGADPFIDQDRTGTEAGVIALLQWEAIIGFGAAAVYVLRYDPRSSSVSSSGLPGVEPDAGRDEALAAERGGVNAGADGRAAGT
jgi:hypothetical protein